MVLTRTESIAALTHILDNVFERGDGTPINEAMEQHEISEMLDLINLCQEDIDVLTYPDPENSDNLINLSMGDKNVIRAFLEYINHRADNGDPIGDTWTSITQEMFAEYRNNRRTALPAPTGTAPTPPTTGTPKTTVSQVDMFRRGIKRDSTQFPTLKDERMKDTWHRQVTNQARAQGVSKVLDENYTPTTPQETELFDEMQKFMYAVLDATVLTDRGRAIVRAHEETYDAQTVYKELKRYHKSSTKAKIESSTLLSYITSAKIGDGSWQGTTESFILNWQDQVRKYENQADATEAFSDAQKRTMLQNAVHPVEELRQVKTNMDLEQTMTGNILTYQQYVNLLLSAAASHDIKFKTKLRRHINMHTVQEDESHRPDHLQYDIDMRHTDLLEAYAMQYQRPYNSGQRVFMPKE